MDKLNPAWRKVNLFHEWNKGEGEGDATAVGREGLETTLYIPVTVRIMKVPTSSLLIFFLFLKRTNKAKENSFRPQNSKFQMLRIMMHTTPYGNPLCMISEQQQQVAKGYRDMVHSRITC